MTGLQELQCGIVLVALFAIIGAVFWVILDYTSGDRIIRQSEKNDL